MDLKRVEELVELMRRAGVTQLAIEVPEYKVSITRGPEGVRVEGPGEPGAVQEPRAPEPEGERAPPRMAAAATALPVVAPVVGVFHNGGMLDPREMVREGDRVREGQLLAAIEAMKVPNEVRAPVAGVVSRLLVEDGAPVEYGQALLLIEPEVSGDGTDGETPVGLA